MAKTIPRTDKAQVSPDTPPAFFATALGSMVHANSLDVLQNIPSETVDLIVTSPPFGLVREKEYGNVPADEYAAWFRPFAEQFRRVLRDSGSLVIDFGGAWKRGQPTKDLYHFEVLIMLCRQYGFHLAQELYWWNPSKLPSPAEWVTVRRIRVKDSINTVWWLSNSPWPKASNRRVLQPYSDSMNTLLKHGYQAKTRPSGHVISKQFALDNGGAIPPNLLAIANTDSNSRYLRYCRNNGLEPHPARFPQELPEFFIRMLTDPGDLVLDPFAGSCVSGEVAERLGRRWLCSELREDYPTGAIGRFQPKGDEVRKPNRPSNYQVARLGSYVPDSSPTDLRKDGGRTRGQRHEMPLPDTKKPGARRRKP